MQIPLWVFLCSLLLSSNWQKMAAVLIPKRVTAAAAAGVLNPTTAHAHIRRAAPLLPSTLHQSFIDPLLSQLHQSTTYNQRFFSTTSINYNNNTTTTTKEMAAASFLADVKSRRTYYQLSNESTISDARIQEIVEHAILHVPSSFNSQSSRAIILLKEEHVKLWNIVKETLKAIVPADAWEHSEQRINGFEAAYGTVLFFINRTTVKGLQEKFPSYAGNMPNWAVHSDGMHQFTIWTALEKEGLGANLQHYNPIIDQKVKATWNVPDDWELTAQLVFGKPTGQPGEKTFDDVKERLKVYGA